MKYTLKNKKPLNDEIIVFKAKKAFYPEVGIWKIYDDGIEEVYIPLNDDVEIIKNIEWWLRIPK